MGYALAADVIVIIHGLVVAFIVGGQAAILAGAALGWRWVRNPVFRVAHLAAIVIVAAQALAGVLCPLTEWEYALRRRAGQSPEDISFAARLVRAVLYHEAPPWVFTTAYVLLAALAAATMVLVPPRLRRGRGATAPGSRRR